MKRTMEQKKITLRICNQDIAVSATEEQECEYRKAAKRVNDDFAKYKSKYAAVEDEKLMACLLLQMAIKNARPNESEP